MRAIVLLLWIAANIALSSGDSFYFSGNLSSKDISDNHWQFRETLYSEVNVPSLYIGGNFYAASIAGSRTNDTINGTAGLVAAATYCALTNFPVTFLTSFEASFELNWNNLGQGAATVDVSASDAYIVIALLALREKDPNGNVVNTLPLKWTIGQSGLSYALTDTSGADDDIKYITFNGTSSDPAFANFSITITHLVSSRAGVVNDTFGLVPGSVESVYDIDNYPYASSNNTLSLVLLVATGSGSVTASGKTVMSGDKKVYVSLSTLAKIKGNKHSINVSEFVTGSLDDLSNSNIQTQLAAKYSDSVTVHEVSVTFPAGATDIEYDPAIGAGASVQESSSDSSNDSNDSSSVTLPLTLFVLLSLFVLLA